jgi:hypothetical protein
LGNYTVIPVNHGDVHICKYVGVETLLKHLAQDETRSTHKEDYVELIRMNADMLVLKHHAETPG